jgi:hypothetical protein
MVGRGSLAVSSGLAVKYLSSAVRINVTDYLKRTKYDHIVLPAHSPKQRPRVQMTKANFNPEKRSDLRCEI